MKYSLFSLRGAAVFLCIIGLTLTVGDTSAQSVHDQIRPSLVYLKATAISTAPGKVGSPVESVGTGLIIANDGQILTVYHLITELGTFEPETLKIKANVGEKVQAPQKSVAIVNALPNVDLMLLKIPEALRDYTPVHLGSTKSMDLSTKLHTSGFSHNIDYTTGSGILTSREGPGGYLWVTNIEFDGGQSGSPVYNDNGEVIGIVKGQLKTHPSTNFFIPIEFAGQLLIPIRLNQLKDMILAQQKSSGIPPDKFRKMLLPELQKFYADTMEARFKTLEEIMKELKIKVRTPDEFREMITHELQTFREDELERRFITLEEVMNELLTSLEWRIYFEKLSRDKSRLIITYYKRLKKGAEPNSADVYITPIAETKDKNEISLDQITKYDRVFEKRTIRRGVLEINEVVSDIEGTLRNLPDKFKEFNVEKIKKLKIEIIPLIKSEGKYKSMSKIEETLNYR